MPGWIEEFLIVLAYSKRTQIALLLGGLSFAGILICGVYFTGRLELHGFLAPLTKAVREALLSRYEGAAWVALGGFLLTAVKCYRKDRKRLFGM